MLESKKYCQMCGKLISDLDDPTTDYYKHIGLKYCAYCRETSDRLKVAARMQEYRKRKKARNRERDMQLELLRQENELLRQRVAQLRQSVEAPEELHSAHRTAPTTSNR
ncbi:MAG: hypothetical protein IIY70_01730 [Oscillospiraceae bacterium]|nr:hypothetical protein [Oscillospiraceae bacterium]